MFMEKVKDIIYKIGLTVFFAVLAASVVVNLYIIFFNPEAK